MFQKESIDKKARGWTAQKLRTAQLISAGVEKLLSRITSHSYSSDPTSPMGASIPVWQTENADLSGAGTLEDDLGWVTAYLYWEGSEKDTTNSCLVITGRKNIIPSGRLWAFAQWSRVVRPGAVRVAVSGSSSTLNMTASKNKDGTVAVQMINSASSSTSVTVKGFSAGSAEAYVTGNSHNNISDTTASLSGEAATVNVSGHAMVTVVLS
ncbi:hypothetical protein Asppvi_005475 [Aspergillus pseudoviridinutans]|uniref:Glycosyl hydrolase family 30 beta sandwich domain-containing protein n=1 Tax=Aspergillus pseudoviridinutans TaxID=1517512 RepID=A0A9P3B9E3_9EURO|nr:uncharacterized protein Asppvi_005475 [Aspergillus pseudoviridinutans]GIJ86585.1 hypothetical protein Asppvi_005475 [Aspergillus pseudoviridinutans]